MSRVHFPRHRPQRPLHVGLGGKANHKRGDGQRPVDRDLEAANGSFTGDFDVF